MRLVGGWRKSSDASQPVDLHSVNHRLTSTWFVPLSLVRTWFVPLPVVITPRGFTSLPTQEAEYGFSGFILKQTNKQTKKIVPECINTYNT